MLQQKIKDVIASVESRVSEREELIHYIAVAMLTRMNLFVLGETGQAKSYAIDLFRRHFEGMNQFQTLMSKQTDREELFGRLDLASIIPGNVSKRTLMQDACYTQMQRELETLMEDYRRSPADSAVVQKQIAEKTTQMKEYRKAMAELHGGSPEFITENKIPQSHICFLDEIFKSSEGLLNALLEALNERRYTNEGVSVDIPVISFFSASNEIPNFSNPEERILRPLYDRFHIKLVTEYIENKDNRLRALTVKQADSSAPITACVTLDELEQMQRDMRKIDIPDSVNELMNTILCELRRNGIHVSDRTFLNYGPLVQAEAWLCSRPSVIPEDLLTLTPYLWSEPGDIPKIKEILRRLCENPVGDKVADIVAKAHEAREDFDNASDKNRALLTLRPAFLALYDEILALKENIPDGDPALGIIQSGIETMENLSRDAHGQTSFTYITLQEIKTLTQTERSA